MTATGGPPSARAPRGLLRMQRGIVLGRSANAVHLAATAVIALGVELAVIAAASTRAVDATWLPIAAAVGAFSLAALLRPYEPAPGEKFTVAAAAAFFGALVLPGPYAVAAVAAAAALAKALQRRSALSSFINVAQMAGATGAASLAAAAIGGRAGVLVAAAAYVAVTLALVAVMITVSQSARAGTSFLARDAVPTAALVGVGGGASVVWWHEPVVLLLFIPILGAIELATRRAAAEHAALAARDGAERAQREFAVDAAHELRTPLTSVIGDLDFLRGTALPAAEQAALVSARSEARRAAMLADRLLLLAKADVDEDPVPSDAAAVARAVLDRASARSQVPVEISASEELPVAVPRELLDVLVGDLLGNAVAYTREGRIHLTARQTGRWVEIAVRDTGIGITREELPRVFDRLYRGARARTMAPGSGLGLAIVRRIVEAHRGSISIESAPGTGTTVRVRLPLADGPTAVPSTS